MNKEGDNNNNFIQIEEGSQYDFLTTDLNLESIKDEISQHLSEINTIKEIGQNENQSSFINKIYVKREELIKLKEEIENEILKLDRTTCEIYKQYLLYTSNTLNSIDHNFISEESEINNIIISLNLLRELTEGKTFEVDEKQKEIYKREENIKEKLSYLSFEELEKFQELCENNYNENVYDTETTVNRKNANEEFDKMSEINFNNYLQDIQASINHITHTENISKINDKLNQIIENNDECLYENRINLLLSKQSQTGGLQKINNNDTITIDYNYEARITLQPETVKNKNNLQLESSNNIKTKTHKRSSSLPVLNELETANKKGRNVGIQRNVSTPAFDKNNQKGKVLITQIKTDKQVSKKEKNENLNKNASQKSSSLNPAYTLNSKKNIKTADPKTIQNDKNKNIKFSHQKSNKVTTSVTPIKNKNILAKPNSISKQKQDLEPNANNKIKSKIIMKNKI